MIPASDLTIFLHTLESGDLAKARDQAAAFPEPEDQFEEGYSNALAGMLSSMENNEKDSLLYKILHKELSEESLQAQYQRCTLRSEESFRGQSERGYERAWGQVCAFFLDDLKAGLDAFQE
jgi:hypothetical protein